MDEEEAEAVRELAERVLEMTADETWNAQVLMSIPIINAVTISNPRARQDPYTHYIKILLSEKLPGQLKMQQLSSFDSRRSQSPLVAGGGSARTRPWKQ